MRSFEPHNNYFNKRAHDFLLVSYKIVSKEQLIFYISHELLLMFFQYNVKKADVSRHDKRYGNYGNYPFVQVDLEFQILQKFDHDGKLKTA